MGAINTPVKWIERNAVLALGVANDDFLVLLADHNANL